MSILYGYFEKITLLFYRCTIRHYELPFTLWDGNEKTGMVEANATDKK